MKNWCFHLQEMPVDEPVLVFLAEDYCGSRIHAGINRKIANGYLMVVAGDFAFDLPDILAWRPMVKNPKEEEALG